jgi:hypothetical protein
MPKGLRGEKRPAARAKALSAGEHKRIAKTAAANRWKK